MCAQENPAREVLQQALVNKTKQFVLEQLDEKMLRDYLVERATQSLGECLQHYDLRNEIARIVEQRVKEMIPAAVEAVVSKQEFKKAFAERITAAINTAVDQGADSLRRALARTVGGEWPR